MSSRGSSVIRRVCRLNIESRRPTKRRRSFAHIATSVSRARIVLAQSVPADDALDSNMFQSALDDALRRASVRGITGKPLTPFLLESIRQATMGQSLRANGAACGQRSSGSRGRCDSRGCTCYNELNTVASSIHTEQMTPTYASPESLNRYYSGDGRRGDGALTGALGGEFIGPNVTLLIIASAWVRKAT